MTTMTSTKTPRNLRPWTLARAAAREQWAWAHPQEVRGIPERILREMLGDDEAERLIAAATLPAPPASIPTLYEYDTGEELRDATQAELAASVEAARHDGGAGVIKVDGVRCYVLGDAEQS